MTGVNSDQHHSNIRMSAPACRPNCGACGIAPSISNPIPGLPRGKPADVPCVQLDASWRCKLFASPGRPACCAGLQLSTEMCGTSREKALVWLQGLEQQTAPAAASPAA